jgi:catechol-2,3-dioxygenase
MPATGLSHYNLRADRQTLDALRDFYVAVVGLTVGYRPPFHNAGYWLYIGEIDVLHLSEAKAGEKRAAHVINTFHHVAFSCSNRSDFEERLRTHAVSFTSDRVPLTNLHQLFCSDPAGNGVELNFTETPA